MDIRQSEPPLRFGYHDTMSKVNSSNDLAAIIAETFSVPMVTRYAMVVEYIDTDGSRGINVLSSAGMASWDATGFLRVGADIVSQSMQGMTVEYDLDDVDLDFDAEDD